MQTGLYRSLVGCLRLLNMALMYTEGEKHRGNTYNYLWPTPESPEGEWYGHKMYETVIGLRLDNAVKNRGCTNENREFWVTRFTPGEITELNNADMGIFSPYYYDSGGTPAMKVIVMGMPRCPHVANALDDNIFSVRSLYIDRSRSGNR